MGCEACHRKLSTLLCGVRNFEEAVIGGGPEPGERGRPQRARAPVAIHALSRVQATQLSLLGRETPQLAPDFAEVQRRRLDARSFLDYLPGFVRGHAALLEHLQQTMQWHAQRRVMYEREVDVPRLTASVSDDGLAHPVVLEAARRLGERYALELDAISLAWYRDGNDSVAWHADRVRDRSHSLVAIVSLGDPRRFLLRPAGGGASIAYGFGHGDLLVMGGACQAGFQHCIPKTRHAHPRLSVMFRNRASMRISRQTQST
jgi:alkylated DNA repair dioxygenase AlkB